MESKPLLADKEITDPQFLKRNNKLLDTDPTKTVVVFILNIILAVPLLLCVLAPITLLTYPIKFFQKKAKDEYVSPVTLEKPSNVTPPAQRPYDLVVYGATGYTGKLAVQYLCRQYGNSIKWAIAGRNKKGLEASLRKANEINKTSVNVDIIVADSSDVASLYAMLDSTRVVISTVGPFDLYGTPLVEAAALYGTHYCDITGETDWVRKMIVKYDEIAKSNKCSIVPHCGHDCVPWDLLTFKLAQELKSTGEELTSVEFYDEINGNVSGGTFATILHSLSNRAKVKTSLGFDPLLKQMDGTKSTSNTHVNSQSMFAFNPKAVFNIGAWVGPFIMSPVLGNCVKRSNALNKYSGESNLKYYEALVYPSFMYGFNQIIYLLIFACFLFSPVLVHLLPYVVPKPGEGPSEEELNNGFLRLHAVGTGSNKSKVQAVLYFDTDVGYRDTARMLVESGLSLAFSPERIPNHGVLSPASAQGDVLLERLLSTGNTKFFMERL